MRPATKRAVILVFRAYPVPPVLGSRRRPLAFQSRDLIGNIAVKNHTIRVNRPRPPPGGGELGERLAATFSSNRANERDRVDRTHTPRSSATPRFPHGSAFRLEVKLAARRIYPRGRCREVVLQGVQCPAPGTKFLTIAAGFRWPVVEQNDTGENPSCHAANEQNVFASIPPRRLSRLIGVIVSWHQQGCSLTTAPHRTMCG